MFTAALQNIRLDELTHINNRFFDLTLYETPARDAGVSYYVNELAINLLAYFGVDIENESS